MHNYLLKRLLLGTPHFLRWFAKYCLRSFLPHFGHTSVLWQSLMWWFTSRFLEKVLTQLPKVHWKPPSVSM